MKHAKLLKLIVGFIGGVMLAACAASQPTETATPTAKVTPTATAMPRQPTSTPVPPTTTLKPPTATPEPTATYTPIPIYLEPGEEPLFVAAVCMNAATDTQTNMETFARYMEQAAGEGAHLVVFPELALQQNLGWGAVGHKPTEEELAYVRDTAKTIPGPSTEWLTQKA